MLKFNPTTFSKRLYSSSSPTKATIYLNEHINLFLSTQVLNLQSLQQSHAYIIATGNTNNIFVASKLISLYASLQKPTSAHKLFDTLQLKDTFLWNSIIKAHFSNGMYSQAFDLYHKMRVSNDLPNQFTVPMVVSACAELRLLKYGIYVHGLISKLGLFAGNSAVGSSFVYMYSKCGSMGDARHVFDEMPVKDVIVWTALVIGYVQNDESEKGLECFCEMHRIGGNEERPNFRTLEGGFQACAHLGLLLEGRCLHGLAVKTAAGCNSVVQSSILSMYSKCGTPEEAHLSFNEVTKKDLVSWTSMISVYAKLGCSMECLRMFLEIQVAGISPDGMVISCVLTGIANSMRVYEGKAFHGLIFRRNFEVDQMVHNALLSMYLKFGLLALSEKLFYRANGRDKESWNIMVVGNSKGGLDASCIKLFREMQIIGIKCDSNSLVSVISSCSRLGATHLVGSLHCHVIKNLFHENISVTNSIIDMYGKSGNLATAQKVFCMTQKDAVTWNALINSYAYNRQSAEALALFDTMVAEGVKPSSATLVTALSACSHIASLEKGEQLHTHIKLEDSEFNLPVATALIDMYAKCGRLEKSREIFDSIEEKDVICWNVMISGYGMHGDAKSAIEIFKQMELSNCRANELTFLAVLLACSHAGLVEEGKFLFDRMKSYFLRPSLKHYACMVDLLGRSGNLFEAEALSLSMPVAPDGGLWGTLLNACRIHNNTQMGIRIAKRAIRSDPNNDGYYIMLSDLYSTIGMWEEAEETRTIMKEKGVRKTAGWSTVRLTGSYCLL